MIEQHGSVDFFFKEGWGPETFRPKKVIVYVEGEYGFIPLIVGKSLEGDNKPCVEILSQHQTVDAFNQYPKMLNPAWTMTHIDKNTVLLSITNWAHLTVDLHSNPGMWQEAYPMIRDIMFGLKEHGCEMLSFITCMNNQEPEERSQLLFYDFSTVKPEKDLILAPPAWIFPFVANRMGIKSTVVCVTQDEGQFIDTEALKLVKEFFVAMGFSYDHEKAKNTIATVRNMESQINEQRWFTDDDEDGAWMV